MTFLADAAGACLAFLKFNRNLSPHTVRAYQTDFEQFIASIAATRGCRPSQVEIAAFDRPPAGVAGLYAILVFIVPYATPAPEGAPGTPGSFMDKVRFKIERVRTALFGGGRHNAQ